MTFHHRTLAFLTACAALASGAAACGAGPRPSNAGAAGDSGPGSAGTTGTAGSTGSAGTTGTAGSTGTAGTTGAAGTTGTGGTTTTPGGIFASLLGHTPADVSSKVTTAVNRYFGIGTNEPTTPTAPTGYRCYYELPQDSSMGFIWAADSDDVRSEGMSYGMMIAVQMNMQTQFDRLWKFSKTYMQVPASSSLTAWRGYFIWQGKVARISTTSWTVTFNSATTGVAPDGDQYFAAALYLADKRWGSAGATNYKAEADTIATAMLHNPATASDGRGPIISASQNMPVFAPQGASANITDPSYHLPAFYELFAASGPSADAAKWRSVASASRGFFVTSANATTGLHPDYATFAGAPTTANPNDGHNTFGFDAWRVVMNMAVDYVWGAADSREKTQIEKYHTFFNAYLQNGNVTQSLFSVDGTNPSGGGSTALTATLAAGGMVSTTSNRTMYVTNLWNIQQQSGMYRYYQESVYLLGLLNAAGMFNKSF